MVRPLAVLALLAACAPEPPEEAKVLANQVASLRVQLRQIEIIAAQYDRGISMATETTCIGVHRTYDLQLRMLVMNATNVTGALDTAITDHGGTGFADVACTVDAIETERSYHGALACQEDAFADDIAEAARHLIALGELTGHLGMRLAEIEAGLELPPEVEVWTWSLPARCSLP